MVGFVGFDIDMGFSKARVAQEASGHGDGELDVSARSLHHRDGRPALGALVGGLFVRGPFCWVGTVGCGGWPDQFGLRMIETS